MTEIISFTPSRTYRSRGNAIAHCSTNLLSTISETIVPHQIFSEASIGKAYFNEMNIRPCREMQPDFPDYLTGIIMSTYFGGRAEVHHRRNYFAGDLLRFSVDVPDRLHPDGFMAIVIANGLNWRDCTSETTDFLQSITLQDLQNPETWHHLTTLVQVSPEVDILPVGRLTAGKCRLPSG